MADLRGWSPPPEEAWDPDGESEEASAGSPGQPPLHLVDLPGLASVDRVVLPPGEAAGLFAVGRGLDGGAAYRWVPLP